MSIKFEFQTSSVLHLPLESYQKDFTFIINGEEIRTNSFVADLLSPKISRLHQIDPTFSEYSIFTKSQGEFKQILSHLTFKSFEVNKIDFAFYSEIFELLEISANDVKIANDPKEQKGVSSINKLEQYIQFPVIYAEEIDKEIESISREFFQLKEEEKKRLQRFPKRIIESLIGHQSLQLESEDFLLEFVNELYAKDREMVDLYSYVYFRNVSKNEMKKFVELVLD